LIEIIEPTNDQSIINAVNQGEPIYESINGRIIKKIKYKRYDYSKYAREEFQ